MWGTTWDGSSRAHWPHKASKRIWHFPQKNWNHKWKSWQVSSSRTSTHSSYSPKENPESFSALSIEEVSKIVRDLLYLLSAGSCSYMATEVLSWCINAPYHWDGKYLSSQWSRSRKSENRRCLSSTEKNLDLIWSIKISFQSLIFHSFPRLRFNNFSSTVKKMLPS